MSTPLIAQPTLVGLNFLASKQGAGLQINVTRFQLGSAFGYNPSINDTALHGTSLFTGTPANYYISPSTQNFTTWAATTFYQVNSVVVPSPANGHYYLAIAAGTSAATQPTFPVTSGGQVTDGTVTWMEVGTSPYTVNTVVWQLVMDSTIGTFNFGEIGLYISNGTGGYILFALMSLSALQAKIATTPTVPGNTIAINVAVQINALTPYVNFTALTSTAAAIPGIANLSLLQKPQASGTNMYVSTTKDEFGNAIQVRAQDTNLWQFPDFQMVIANGSVTSATNTTVTSTAFSSINLFNILAPSTTWVASTGYNKYQTVNPTVANGFFFVATVAGTSAATQPVWPTVVGNTVVDGTVTWMCQAVIPAGYLSALGYRYIIQYTSGVLEGLGFEVSGYDLNQTINYPYGEASGSAPAANDTFNLYRANSFQSFNRFVTEYQISSSHLMMFGQYSG